MPRYKDAMKINPPTVGEQLLNEPIDIEQPIRESRKTDIKDMKEDIAYLRQEIVKVQHSLKELVDRLEQMQSVGLRMRPNQW